MASYYKSLIPVFRVEWLTISESHASRLIV